MMPRYSIVKEWSNRDPDGADDRVFARNLAFFLESLDVHRDRLPDVSDDLFDAFTLREGVTASGITILSLG